MTVGLCRVAFSVVLAVLVFGVRVWQYFYVEYMTLVSVARKLLLRTRKFMMRQKGEVFE